MIVFSWAWSRSRWVSISCDSCSAASMICVELVEPFAHHRARLVPADQRVLGGLHLLSFGQMLTPMPELVGHRVGRLQLEDRVGHDVCRSAASYHLVDRSGRERGVGVEDIGRDGSAALDRTDRSVRVGASSLSSPGSRRGRRRRLAGRRFGRRRSRRRTETLGRRRIVGGRRRWGRGRGRLVPDDVVQALVAGQVQPRRSARLGAGTIPVGELELLECRSAPCTHPRCGPGTCHPAPATRRPPRTRGCCHLGVAVGIANHDRRRQLRRGADEERRPVALLRSRLAERRTTAREVGQAAAAPYRR